jgi:hypothetical protein
MAAARPSQTVNAASAPARPNSSALWPIRSSDSSVSSALMTAVEPQQPSYLAHSDAAAAPVERFPHRQTLIVSHRPQSLPSPPLSIPDQSIAFTECGQHRDRQSLSGSPGALPRRGPLRTVRARFPGTRLKQAPQARVQVEQLAPALHGRRFADARSGRARGGVRRVRPGRPVWPARRSLVGGSPCGSR